MTKVYLLLIVCLVQVAELHAAEAPAPPPLTQLPIHIEADTVDLDEPKGISVYRGNVKIRQGDLSMQADTLTVHVVDGTIHRLKAEGKPVTLHRQSEPPLRAEAVEMEYFAAEGRVVFAGQAHLWQGLNEFSGNRIEYLMEKDLITASKSQSGDQRVQVILHPQKKQAPKKTQP